MDTSLHAHSHIRPNINAGLRERRHDHRQACGNSHRRHPRNGIYYFHRNFYFMYRFYMLSLGAHWPASTRQA
jgi:hypothetical protein